MVLTIDAQGERYAIKMHMKNDQKAFFHMRLPAWASSSEILVNGAPTAEYRLVDGCIGIERVWHDGDEIVAVLEQPVMRHNSAYHQATYLTRGPQVLALSADGDWAYALCGNGKVTENGVTAPFAPIAWKRKPRPSGCAGAAGTDGRHSCAAADAVCGYAGAHCAFPAGG